MSMSDWAKREVEKAKSELKDSDMREYEEKCFDSALKIYLELMNEGHSGMSFSVTKSILEDLINEVPLTPITGDDEEWDYAYDIPHHCIVYQNKRCYSLFKEVGADGTIKYHDQDYIIGREKIGNGDYVSVYSRFIEEVMKGIVPEIKFPYFKNRNPYFVYFHDCDDGTIVVEKYVTPKGEEVELNVSYKETQTEDGKTQYERI